MPIMILAWPNCSPVIVYVYVCCVWVCACVSVSQCVHACICYCKLLVLWAHGIIALINRGCVGETTVINVFMPTSCIHFFSPAHRLYLPNLNQKRQAFLCSKQQLHILHQSLVCYMFNKFDTLFLHHVLL